MNKSTSKISFRYVPDLLEIFRIGFRFILYTTVRFIWILSFNKVSFYTDHYDKKEFHHILYFNLP